MKKILFASIILVLIPTIIFVPIYALMFHTANSNVKNYTEDIIGNWEAFQYYYESERVNMYHININPNNFRTKLKLPNSAASNIDAILSENKDIIAVPKIANRINAIIPHFLFHKCFFNIITPHFSSEVLCMMCPRFLFEDFL